VAWAKQKTGITHKLGSGGRGYVQGQEPKIGSIGVEAGGYPHAVVIVDIRGEDIIINESNYHKDWVTQRTLSKANFLGFIYN
jgi:surface antigen